jgi:hypothetical protein
MDGMPGSARDGLRVFRDPALASFTNQTGSATSNNPHMNSRLFSKRGTRPMAVPRLSARNLALRAAILLPALPCALAQSPVAFTPDRMRQWLADPPAIESMVFTRRLENPVGAFASRKAAEHFLKRVAADPAALAPAAELFFLRSQTEPPGHIFRQIRSLDDLADPTADRLLVFSGHFGSNWWWLQPGEITLVTLSEAEAAAKAPNICSEAVRFADEVMRLGMFEVLPDSFRWDMTSKTNFACATEFLGAATGHVETSSDGIVRGATYRLSTGEVKTLLFEYQRPLPEGLPTRITIRRQVPGQPASALYCTFEILQLNLGAAPLARESFSPEPFMRKEDIWTEIDMKGNAFLLDGTNRLAMATKPPLLLGSHWSYFGRALVLVAAALALVVTAKRFRGIRPSVDQNATQRTGHF